MSFGLLDKVNNITNNKPLTPAYKVPTTVLRNDFIPDEDCCVQQEAHAKSLYNIQTLTPGDRIIDNEGVIRWVVNVIGNKVVLTGIKTTSFSNIKKTFTWTQDKINNAINEKGFRLV